MESLSINEICRWFEVLKRRRAYGERVPSISEVADRACLSRHTVYALLRDERSEFGIKAQIRLSRVIAQVSTDERGLSRYLLCAGLSRTLSTVNRFFAFFMARCNEIQGLVLLINRDNPFCPSGLRCGVIDGDVRGVVKNRIVDSGSMQNDLHFNRMRDSTTEDSPATHP